MMCRTPSYHRTQVPTLFSLLWYVHCYAIRPLQHKTDFHFSGSKNIHAKRMIPVPVATRHSTLP
jgi:hypothetical protein